MNLYVRTQVGPNRKMGATPNWSIQMNKTKKLTNKQQQQQKSPKLNKFREGPFKAQKVEP